MQGNCVNALNQWLTDNPSHPAALYPPQEIIPIYEAKSIETDLKSNAPLGKCLGLQGIAHDSLNDVNAAIDFYKKSIHAFSKSFQNFKAIESYNPSERDNFMFYASIELRKAKLHDKISQETKAMRHYQSKTQKQCLVHYYNFIFY